MAMGKLARLVDGNTAQPADVAGAKPRPVDLDPRPDLEEDHRDWVAVLAQAWQEVDAQGNRPTWDLLHGLRCGGARLELRHTAQGKPFYKLDYMPLLRWWDEGELRRRWLEPYRDRIKAVLQLALETKRAAEAELAAQKAAR